jgi:hypothetical protein
MNIRKIDLSKDYETLNKWLIGHNKPVLSRDLYSDSGFMINELVAGFLYKTNSSICLVENIISDPSSEKNERRRAINTVFETIVKEAKNLNFKMIFTAVELNSLHKNLIDIGFIDLQSDKLMFRSL